MNLLKLKLTPSPSLVSHLPKSSHFHPISFKFPFSPPFPSSTARFPFSSFTPTCKVSSFKLRRGYDDHSDDNTRREFEDLAPDGVVYRNTLRLVECSMFAAVTGLVYFLSNSLSIENYFGCFFSLPIVISSMRWGVAAGRKTMYFGTDFAFWQVATAMLLFVLSGPLKALTYLLTHGIVGFTMGSLWRSRADWGLSIFGCTIARAMGAMGYVFLTSFLIRENILALITINIHASLTVIFSAIGVNSMPSMNLIYTLFGILVLLNSASFVFLLHLLYAVFFTRFGMRDSLRLPKWLEKAL